MGCFFVFSCENNMQEVQNLAKKKLGVEEAKNIESYMSQGGKTKAILKAPLMLRYQQDTPRVEFPKTLSVVFYNDSLKPESFLFARHGEYRENENKVFLKDSVIVYNITGDTLHTKDLNWDQTRSIFYTDKNVIILKKDQKIYGRGLIADQGFKWFTIKKVQNSVISIPDGNYLDQ